MFKFRNQAVAPLDPKFSLSWASINISIDSDFFNHNNKIMTQLFLLRTRLQTYCLNSVFAVIPINPTTGNINTNQSPIDLLDHACITPEIIVQMSNLLYAKSAVDKMHAQNLAWTQDLLFNSCDATLRRDLEHRLITIPDNEQGGPLVLHMILNQPMSTTHDAARAIINRLQVHLVTDYPGENITNFAATFNNVVFRLFVSGYVPSDVANIFFNRLCATCTVPKFVAYLEKLEHTDHPVIHDFQSLRETAVRKYTHLLLAEKWLPNGKTTASSFSSTQIPATTISDIRVNTTSGNGGRDPTQTLPSSTTDRPAPVIDRTPPADSEPNWRSRAANPKLLRMVVRNLQSLG